MKDKQIRVECHGATILRLGQLKEFQGGLKNLSKQNYDRLRRSILNNGFSFAFHVWKSGSDFFILDGHQRYRTLAQMQKEGYDIPPLPIVNVQAKSYREAKRKLLSGASQYGEMEAQGLREQMSEADYLFEDLQAETHFPEIDFERFEQEFFEDPIVGETDPDAVTSVPKKPKTKPGDLYTLGNHRLLCGDATKREDVEKLMNGEKADMVFTDPPYNLAGTREIYAKDAWGKSHKELKESKWDQNFDISKMLPRLLEIVENGWLYVCCGHPTFGTIYDFFQENDLKNFYCVWTKNNPFPSLTKSTWLPATELVAFAKVGKTEFQYPNDGHALNWFEHNIEQANRVHPTQKPIAVVEHFLMPTSQPNDLVVDLFMGSGSTLIACEKTQRRCFGMEIDPHYVDVAVQRWEDFTGSKATLIRGKD